jgi:meso-butanediol dehydrogenase / (S,S)-butanediol dehydrogenase / diacetyl reductase
MPRYELDGQVAIVTGAGRGIGRAIALRLAKEGADVVVSDIDMHGAESVASEIRSLGRKGLALVADVSKKPQADAMVAETKSRFGKLDILINNAGVAVIRPLMETDEASWDFVQSVNVKGILFCTQAAAKEMMVRKSGRIINMASGAGKTAPARELGLGAYSVSKFAVVGLTKSFANELAPFGILVNCICPGIVDTPMWDAIDREAAKRENVPIGSVKARAVATVPVGRIQQPEDVANVIAFLASSDASYITGQAVDASGGLIPV